jgi:4-hydroxy-tetrahydrodipicolinate reductase
VIKLLLSGAYGNLCRVVADCAREADDLIVIGGIDPGQADSSIGFPVFATVDAIADVRPDILIDFSHPLALPELLEYAVRENIPCVFATTGYVKSDLERLRQAGQHVPIFYSRNMSIGVALLKELVAHTSRILGESFDIEIIEQHHNKKIDAPSGTALILAEAANSGLNEAREYAYCRHDRSAARPKNEIGIHAIRGGTIVGEHSVMFAGLDEVITLSHTASSKRLFAAGAIRAARFLLTQPAGLYNMDDLVALCGCG